VVPSCRVSMCVLSTGAKEQPTACGLVGFTEGSECNYSMDSVTKAAVLFSTRGGRPACGAIVARGWSSVAGTRGQQARGSGAGSVKRPR